MWLSGNKPIICGDLGLIPGPTQWVKDLVLLVCCSVGRRPGRIWQCCGCDIGQQLQHWEGTQLNRTSSAAGCREVVEGSLSFRDINHLGVGASKEVLLDV